MLDIIVSIFLGGIAGFFIGNLLGWFFFGGGLPFNLWIFAGPDTAIRKYFEKGKK